MNNNIKKAGFLVNNLLNELEEKIIIGSTGNILNDYAEYALKWFCSEAQLACKGFHGFPKSICVSINEEIIHGIPDDRVFVEGDIIKIDLVIFYNGWYADAARSIIVGKGKEEDKKLVKITKECLYKAIEVAREGKTTGHIGFVIEKHATRNNFSIMKDFSGHGIGEQIHMEPNIPCFGNKGKGYKLKEGDFICIEPMLFAGKNKIIKENDGWGISSKDSLNTAHFEHTIEIQKRGLPIIIT